MDIVEYADLSSSGSIYVAYKACDGTVHEVNIILDPMKYDHKTDRSYLKVANNLENDAHALDAALPEIRRRILGAVENPDAHSA